MNLLAKTTLFLRDESIGIELSREKNPLGAYAVTIVNQEGKILDRLWYTYRSIALKAYNEEIATLSDPEAF